MEVEEALRQATGGVRRWRLSVCFLLLLQPLPLLMPVMEAFSTRCMLPCLQRPVTRCKRMGRRRRRRLPLWKVGGDPAPPLALSPGLQCITCLAAGWLPMRGIFSETVGDSCRFASVSSIAGQLSASKADSERLQAALDAAAAAAAELEQRCGGLDADLAAARAELQDVQAQVEGLMAELAAAQERGVSLEGESRGRQLLVDLLMMHPRSQQRVSVPQPGMPVCEVFAA